MLRYIFNFCAYGNQCCANLCKRRVTSKIGNVIFDTLVTEGIRKKRFVNSEKSFMVFFAFVEEIIRLALTANGKKKNKGCLLYSLTDIFERRGLNETPFSNR